MFATTPMSYRNCILAMLTFETKFASSYRFCAIFDCSTFWEGDRIASAKRGRKGGATFTTGAKNGPPSNRLGLPDGDIVIERDSQHSQKWLCHLARHGRVSSADASWFGLRGHRQECLCYSRRYMVVPLRSLG